MTTEGAGRTARATQSAGYRTAIVGSTADQEALARLVTTGAAAKPGRRDVTTARSIVLAACADLRAHGRHAPILVTPAGFIQHNSGEGWSGTRGWPTAQPDFDLLASIAEGVVRDLASEELCSVARGAVEHLIIGIDVWPTDRREPHAEVACHVDLSSGAARAVTGKSYPTGAQQDDVILEPDLGSHVVPLGDEQVAVLVCHDLAAWSPRGNAVAKHIRRDTWRAMQDVIASARPTLAVHLAHTVDTSATWTPAWSRYEARSGGRLRAATTAICHLDRHWNPRAEAPTEKLLAGTGRGRRAIDIIVSA